MTREEIKNYLSYKVSNLSEQEKNDFGWWQERNTRGLSKDEDKILYEFLKDVSCDLGEKIIDAIKILISLTTKEYYRINYDNILLKRGSIEFLKELDDIELRNIIVEYAGNIGEYDWSNGDLYDEDLSRLRGITDVELIKHILYIVGRRVKNHRGLSHKLNDDVNILFASPDKSRGGALSWLLNNEFFNISPKRKKYTNLIYNTPDLSKLECLKCLMNKIAEYSDMRGFFNRKLLEKIICLIEPYNNPSMFEELIEIIEEIERTCHKFEHDLKSDSYYNRKSTILSEKLDAYDPVYMETLKKIYNYEIYSREWAESKNEIVDVLIQNMKSKYQLEETNIDQEKKIGNMPKQKTLSRQKTTH